jgi:hypothetical protein
MKTPLKDTQASEMNAQDIYDSCKKLLFKVDLVIKNAKGE